MRCGALEGRVNYDLDLFLFLNCNKQKAMMYYFVPTITVQGKDSSLWGDVL